MLRTHVILFILLLSYTAEASADRYRQSDSEGAIVNTIQSASRTGRTRQIQRGPFTFHVHTPPDYSPDSGKLYPVLVVLHWAHVTGPAFLHFWDKDGDDADLIVVAPDSKNSAYWTPKDGVNIHRMLEELQAQYSIDSTRIWLAGYANGGEFAYHLIFTFPYMFNAVLTIGGYPNQSGMSNHPGEKKRLPRICIFEGTSGNTANPHRGTATKKLLGRLGYSVRYAALANIGHWMPRDEGPNMLRCLAGGQWRHRLERTSEVTTRRPRYSLTRRNVSLQRASSARHGQRNTRWLQTSATEWR